MVNRSQKLEMPAIGRGACGFLFSDLRICFPHYRSSMKKRHSQATAFKPIKPFQTYEEQIDNLITRKGLIINDVPRAIKSLENISYYALIDGYKDLFYNPDTRTYLPGTTFDDIHNLYNFDASLRDLIFSYNRIVEQSIRSLVSRYYFILHYI